MRAERFLIAIKLLALVAVTTAAVAWPRPGPASASGVAAVIAGKSHTCALTMEGGVKCWGLNSYGQLGDGTTQHSAVPVDVSGLTSGVMAIAAGFDHTCALLMEGGVKCWGFNSNGQLGDGTTLSSVLPVDVAGLAGGGSAIAAGGYHTCALTAEGVLQCWGYNYYGQLGDGTTVQRLTAVTVGGLAGDPAAITAGWLHTCALSGLGDLQCWGRNDYDQLGFTTTEYCALVTHCSTTPTRVLGMTGVAATVTAGIFHTCASLTDGSVNCWGGNGHGQLGDGTGGDLSDTSAVPVEVVGLEDDVEAVAGGGYHTCAVTAGGAMMCWGQNNHGQLGDGMGANQGDLSTVPVAVSGMDAGSATVGAGRYHSCALSTGGGLKCWGSNGSGQVGDGTNYNMRATPVRVEGMGEPPDADNDGCADKQELGPDPRLGGGRDPGNFWDFYDTPTGTWPDLARDRSVSGVDVFAVLGRFNATDDGPGDFDRNSDPLSLPNAPAVPTGDRANYHPAYDRTSPAPGADLWDTGPPDGAISGLDFFAVLAQFNHDCS